MESENRGGLEQREQLELDAVRALAGADYTLKQVLAAVTMGSPSIDDLAYLIKSRIKSHGRLVEKVMDRRSKGRTDYQVKDITDIIGLRILALYRNQLPFLVERFLSLIEITQREPFSLFFGSSLHDAIREAIVYKTSDEGDSSLLLTTNVFRRAGFVVDPTGNAPQAGNTPVVRIIKKSNEYSSIHLVLYCNGINRDRRFVIPMEVQIRTALEDVWGEIHHTLEYKARRDPDDLSGSKREFYDSALQGLRTLKGLLDRCSDQADQIKYQINLAFDVEQHVVPERIGSIDVQMLRKLGLPDRLQNRVNALVVNELQLFKEILAPHGIRINYSHAIQEFGKISIALTKCFEEYCASPFTESDQSDQDIRVRYYLPLEAALCLYWQGRLIKAASKAQPEALTADISANASGTFDDALRRYLKLEEEFSGDPIIAYRIGNTLEAEGGFGDREAAREKYKEAVHGLEACTLPPHHYMRVKIPRHLGLAYWAAADDIRKQAERLRNGDFFRPRRGEYYLKAIRATMPVFEKKIEVEEEDTFLSPEEEHIITANNIVDYAICFVSVGGQWAALEKEGVNESFVRTFLDQELVPSRGERLKNVTKPGIADTVRAAARHLLHDTVLEHEAARRVLELLDSGDWSVAYDFGTIEDMRKDAEISLGSNPRSK